jgi:hypothetical protein
VEVSILPRCVSDHNPSFITYSNSSEFRWTKRRQFRFEAAWAKDSRSKEIIKKEWRVKGPRGDSWGQVRKKLDRCKKSLQVWVRKTVKQGERLLQAKQMELSAIQSLGNPDLVEQEKRIQEELLLLLDQEDLIWRQRAKTDWLKEGDRNTKYFHAWASQHSRRNTISEIVDHHGALCSNQGTIEAAFVSYFQDLFIAGNNLNVEACIRHV